MVIRLDDSTDSWRLRRTTSDSCACYSAVLCNYVAIYHLFSLYMFFLKLGLVCNNNIFLGWVWCGDRFSGQIHAMAYVCHMQNVCS